MEFLNKALAIGLLFCVVGCGVKGRPLPPLNPAPIGRGEPTFQDEQKKPVKKSGKKNLDKQADDPVEAEE